MSRCIYLSSWANLEHHPRTLEESNKQNHRIRQMLNRISASVREYESAQISSAKKPGVPYHHLPKELLDAFSHDPAAVTGSTRRLRGWRAVEDIHQRVIRQREIFHAFLSDPPPYPDISESILSGPAQGLLSTLEILEEHNDHIGSLTTEISRTLQDVQKMHADTKKEYNRTVSKTSVLYPEVGYYLQPHCLDSHRLHSCLISWPWKKATGIDTNASMTLAWTP